MGKKQLSNTVQICVWSDINTLGGNLPLSFDVEDTFL